MPKKKKKKKANTGKMSCVSAEWDSDISSEWDSDDIAVSEIPRDSKWIPNGAASPDAVGHQEAADIKHDFAVEETDTGAGYFNCSLRLNEAKDSFKQKRENTIDPVKRHYSMVEPSDALNKVKAIQHVFQGDQDQNKRSIERAVMCRSSSFENMKILADLQDRKQLFQSGPDDKAHMYKTSSIENMRNRATDSRQIRHMFELLTIKGEANRQSTGLTKLKRSYSLDSLTSFDSTLDDVYKVEKKLVLKSCSTESIKSITLLYEPENKSLESTSKETIEWSYRLKEIRTFFEKQVSLSNRAVKENIHFSENTSQPCGTSINPTTSGASVESKESGDITKTQPTSEGSTGMSTEDSDGRTDVLPSSTSEETVRMSTEECVGGTKVQLSSTSEGTTVDSKENSKTSASGLTVIKRSCSVDSVTSIDSPLSEISLNVVTVEKKQVLKSASTDSIQSLNVLEDKGNVTVDGKVRVEHVCVTRKKEKIEWNSKLKKIRNFFEKQVKLSDKGIKGLPRPDKFSQFCGTFNNLSKSNKLVNKSDHSTKTDASSTSPGATRETDRYLKDPMDIDPSWIVVFRAGEEGYVREMKTFFDEMCFPQECMPTTGLRMETMYFREGKGLVSAEDFKKAKNSISSALQRMLTDKVYENNEVRKLLFGEKDVENESANLRQIARKRARFPGTDELQQGRFSLTPGETSHCRPETGTSRIFPTQNTLNADSATIKDIDVDSSTESKFDENIYICTGTVELAMQQNAKREYQLKYRDFQSRQKSLKRQNGQLIVSADSNRGNTTKIAADQGIHVPETEQMSVGLKENGTSFLSSCKKTIDITTASSVATAVVDYTGSKSKTNSYSIRRTLSSLNKEESKSRLSCVDDLVNSQPAIVAEIPQKEIVQTQQPDAEDPKCQPSPKKHVTFANPETVILPVDVYEDSDEDSDSSYFAKDPSDIKEDMDNIERENNFDLTGRREEIASLSARTCSSSEESSGIAFSGETSCNRKNVTTSDEEADGQHPGSEQYISLSSEKQLSDTVTKELALAYSKVDEMEVILQDATVCVRTSDTQVSSESVDSATNHLQEEQEPLALVHSSDLQVVPEFIVSSKDTENTEQKGREADRITNASAVGGTNSLPASERVEQKEEITTKVVGDKPKNNRSEEKDNARVIAVVKPVAQELYGPNAGADDVVQVTQHENFAGIAATLAETVIENHREKQKGTSTSKQTDDEQGGVDSSKIKKSKKRFGKSKSGTEKKGKGHRKGKPLSDGPYGEGTEAPSSQLPTEEDKTKCSANVRHSGRRKLGFFEAVRHLWHRTFSRGSVEKETKAANGVDEIVKSVLDSKNVATYRETPDSEPSQYWHVPHGEAKISSLSKYLQQQARQSQISTAGQTTSKSSKDKLVLSPEARKGCTAFEIITDSNSLAVDEHGAKIVTATPRAPETFSDSEKEVIGQALRNSLSEIFHEGRSLCNEMIALGETKNVVMQVKPLLFLPEVQPEAIE